MALIREDLALAAQAAGEVVLWEPAHIETELQFLWLKTRSAEPPLGALVSLMQQTWSVAGRLIEPIAA